MENGDIHELLFWYWQQVGLSRARRLAQGQTIKIQLFAALPVQIDGEPWFQQPCTLAISHHGQVLSLSLSLPLPLCKSLLLLLLLINKEKGR